MKKMNLGLVGLAVMGQNLVLNMERNGYSAAVYNRSSPRTEEFMEQRAKGLKIKAAYTPGEFVKLCAKPRKIFLMVKAGNPVDITIAQLLPHLQKGDIIVECGNSHFRDTEKRMAQLKDKGLSYLGTGISGGEEGALNGPSIMPGGDPGAYEHIRPILRAIAAKVEGEPCCEHMGPGGAGHFVKMTHNGIEYAIMQAIAEIYHFMREGLELSPGATGEYFSRWNESLSMGGYLLEITAKILQYVDHHTAKPLVEVIKDTARHKGTGTWVSQVACDLGVPVQSINAALLARIISAYKDERMSTHSVLMTPDAPFRGNRDSIIRAMSDALEAAVIIAYIQGFVLMKAGSDELGYSLKLASIARIWRGGCIIRSKLLPAIAEEYEREPELSNLLLSPSFSEMLNLRISALRDVVKAAISSGIPVPVLSQTISYFDSYGHDILPAASLIQAMRDYFGAHTYERFDMPGTFHTAWSEENHPEYELSKA